jgi:hypothetical protein
MNPTEASPKPADAEIVSGPTPDDSGLVLFQVRVGDRLVETYAEACGVGFSQDEDLEVASRAMSAVFRFLSEHEGEKLNWYREAARLRRVAGNPPPLDCAVADHITVRGTPVQYDGFVVFWIDGVSMDLKIMVSAEGGVHDECSDWSALADGDRSAAFAAALAYLFFHREEVTAMGLDVGLLDELYRYSCRGAGRRSRA